MTVSPTFVTTADGSQIAVHDFGGEGRPLLLAHATGFHAHALHPLARHLAGHFRCFAFDARAHGDSRAAETWTGDWRGFADDVTSVVGELGLEQPLGFGHSCGGAALLLAEAGTPGLFGSLYCYEPVVQPTDDPPGPSYENPLSAGTLRRREIFESKQEAEANFGSKPPMASFRPDVLHEYVEHGFETLAEGTARLKCRRSDEARVYAYGGSHRAYSRLPEIACPVTLTCGELTDSFGLPTLEAVGQRLRDRRIEVFPGLSHFGPLEDPEAVATSMIRAFDIPPA